MSKMANKFGLGWLRKIFAINSGMPILNLYCKRAGSGAPEKRQTTTNGIESRWR